MDSHEGILNDQGMIFATTFRLYKVCVLDIITVIDNLKN